MLRAIAAVASDEDAAVAAVTSVLHAYVDGRQARDIVCRGDGRCRLHPEVDQVGRHAGGVAAYTGRCSDCFWRG